jgi:MFS family permease
MFSGFVMVVQFFATVRGESPVSVGIHSLFWTAGPMIVSSYAAGLGRAKGAVRVAALGLTLVAAGMLSLAVIVSPDAGVLALAPALVAIGVGIGLVLPNVVAAALAVVPAADMGKASAVVNTSRQLGAVAGVAVGVAVFQAQGGVGAAATTNGIRAALLVSAGAAGVGALSALAARQRQVAPAAVAEAATA